MVIRYLKPYCFEFISVLSAALTARTLYTFCRVYPAVPTCSTHSTQLSQYPQYRAVPTGTVSTQMHPQYYPQYPAVPTGTVQYPDASTVPTVPAVLPYSSHLQYPQYRDCRSTHGYCAVPARVTISQKAKQQVL